MVTGIIAEYNPFHNGHKLQIDYARNTLNADYIVVALSPDYTQRGEVALLSKYERAEIALKMGVDLVIQIPVNAATDSSMGYAFGGVKLLDSLGIVDTLLFSAEDNNMGLLSDISDIELSEDIAYKEALNLSLRQGLSFPFARERAIADRLPDTYSNTIHELLSGSNNILAIEYIKALKLLKSSIKPLCMKRIGPSYNDNHIGPSSNDNHISPSYNDNHICPSYIDTCINGNIASATAIRNAIFNDQVDAVKDVVPKSTFPIYKELINNKKYAKQDDITLLLAGALLNCDARTFESYKDCTTDLAYKIMNNLHPFSDYNEFKVRLKSKNYTDARISRVLCHIMLGINNNLYDNVDEKFYPYIPYIFILGMTSRGEKLMGQIKSRATLPYFTSLNDILEYSRGLNDTDSKVIFENVLHSDIHATKIYNMLLARNSNQPICDEHSRKFLFV